jgi:steroid 5-alpha reductase family enzyme
MLTSVIVIYGMFLVLFIIGTIIKNNSIVDIFWGLGFVLSAWIIFFIVGEYTLTKVIVNILVSLWGLRLFYHIAKRNIGEKEDFRYRNWRKAWGKYVVPRAFLQVYMLQATFMFIISLGVTYININNYDFSMISFLGVGLFFVGYYFQVIGDYELKEFVKNKRGLLQTGLWSITRHPNYFGESVMWFGIALYALLNGAPWFVVVSPLTITIILRFISIPLLEEKMSKREGWDTYSKRVNIMFPWVKK